ncbi:hypothetical protein SKAU_G00043320 [Synaphobranchus kaupii]|uniref:Uncharacterized protein n=1 Tax=Synaphobranchus kaupii TaxID=118154 RepID=A0A9Q1G2I2_SYNKA|nr:hypothetical protein SKAU_G00043320 [Synaphobranchus kaupii]
MMNGLMSEPGKTLLELLSGAAIDKSEAGGRSRRPPSLTIKRPIMGRVAEQAAEKPAIVPAANLTRPARLAVIALSPAADGFRALVL